MSQTERRLADDYNSLIKKAQEQPGIAELMQVYGTYDSLVKQANAYLGTSKAKILISSTNTSS